MCACLYINTYVVLVVECMYVCIYICTFVSLMLDCQKPTCYRYDTVSHEIHER